MLSEDVAPVPRAVLVYLRAPLQSKGQAENEGALNIFLTQQVEVQILVSCRGVGRMVCGRHLLTKQWVMYTDFTRFIH